MSTDFILFILIVVLVLIFIYRYYTVNARCEEVGQELTWNTFWNKPELYEMITSSNRGTPSERYLVSNLLSSGFKPTAIYHDLMVESGKGKTFAEVYKEDPKYIFWLLESDPFYKIDLPALTGIAVDDEHAEEKFHKEIDRVFPKVKVEDKITFGKYKGKTYKEVFAEDSQYIEWFVRNNDRLDLDKESFRSLWQK